VNKGKRRMTLMIIAVISSFVLCWAPIQIMFFLQHILKTEFDETEIFLLVLSNCVGYLNACVNPVIYGFANREFRTYKYIYLFYYYLIINLMNYIIKFICCNFEM
jgi:cyanate permease